VLFSQYVLVEFQHRILYVSGALFSNLFSMKKHWQIRPWAAFVVLAVMVLSLLYAFGEPPVKFQDMAYNISNATGGEISRSFGLLSASDAPMISEASMEKSYRTAEVMNDSDDGGNDRMIIKTGSVSMVVDDVRESARAIIDYAESNGGFLVNSSIDKSGIALYGEVVVRIPAKIFEAGMGKVKEMGDTKSENVNGRDVTEEFVDLEAQLGNYEATEEQFLSIMKKANKIEDILAVQRELMYVRENIERTEGRMKYLSESVDLSTLSVYLSTDPDELPIVDDEDKWKPFAVFKDAIRSLLGTGEGLVNLLIWGVVYLPVLVVIGLIAYVIRKRYHKK